MLSAKLIPIRKSSCFDASGYFDGRAAFRYRSNGRVIYRTIPVSLWQRFMESESKGKFYRKYIRKFAGGAGGDYLRVKSGHSSKKLKASNGLVTTPLCDQVRGDDFSSVSAVAIPQNQKGQPNAE